jgi:hypothetical protein
MVLAFVAVAGAAHAGSKPKIKGKGIYAGGSRFQFVVKGEGGLVEFEHPNFGGTTLVGEIDCIYTFGALASVSGVIETPLVGAHYFQLIAFDGKGGGGPGDLLGAVISAQPLECELDPDDLGSGPPQIERGNIVVKVPQS